MVNKRLVFETELQKYDAETKPLASGGSGQVFAAAGDDGEQYAIKVLAPELATSSKLKRFKNELTFGRKVRHDHIVPVSTRARSRCVAREPLSSSCRGTTLRCDH